MSWNTKDKQNGAQFCTANEKTCFKSRVAAVVDSMPGYRFSSYAYITLTKPAIIMTESQYRTVFGKMVGEDFSQKELPMMQLMVKMNDSLSEDQKMTFISAL